jgi:arylsulfatase
MLSTEYLLANAKNPWAKTALFGKWHMGDRNEYLPTAHGFDEFYGLMYHLNLMGPSRQSSQIKLPRSSRNMIHSWATNKIWMKPKIQEDGESRNTDWRLQDILMPKMETIDEDFLAMSEDWLESNKWARFFVV